MAGPYVSNVQDPEAWEGMPAPASAGDPDEQMRNAARAGQDQDRAREAAPQLFPASQRASGAPVTAQPTTETDPAKIGLMGLQRELNAGDETMASAREMQDDPRIEQLQQKRLTDEANKPNAESPDYKVGFGTRLLRGLKGAAEGIASGKGALPGVIDPAKVGAKAYGAPNDAYDTAVDKYNQTLATDDEMASNTATNFKRNQDLRVAREKGLNEGATTYGHTVTGGVDLAKLQDPEGKNALAIQTQTRRLNFANSDPILSKPGYTRSRYLATGEIQPAKEPTFEEQEYNRQVSGWNRANPGQKMTPEIEQQIYQSVRKPGEAGGNDAVGAIVADATGKKQEFINNYERQADGSYLRRGAPKYGTRKENDFLTPDQYAAKVEQFRLDANQALVKHGAEIGADGQIVRKSASLREAIPSAPGAPPAAPRPPAGNNQPPTPKEPAPAGTADMARDKKGQWHYRDAQKRDLGLVK